MLFEISKREYLYYRGEHQGHGQHLLIKWNSLRQGWGQYGACQWRESEGDWTR